MLFKTKPQLLLKWGRGHPCKYLLLIAVVEVDIIDAIIDIDAFIGNIADITNITIYL